VAAHWITADQLNPLTIDWAQGTELCKPALTHRVIDRILSHQGEFVVIVQKFEINSLYDHLDPLPSTDHYAVVRAVRKHLTRTDETLFFELYE
jgi:hypothetical protein